MKKGDLVRVRVVGLGAYLRKFHDGIGIILETHSKRGKLLQRWRVLWNGKVTDLSPEVLEVIDEGR